MPAWIRLSAMAIGAMTLVASAAGSATAHDDHGWKHRRGHHHHYYDPPRRVFYVERPVYYAPPRPVFIEPQPYYGPPSLNINIPLR